MSIADESSQNTSLKLNGSPMSETFTASPTNTQPVSAVEMSPGANDTGFTLENVTVSDVVNGTTNGKRRTLSAVAIRAKKTATLEERQIPSRHLSAVNSSGLLSTFVLALWSEKTPQQSEQMPLGLGGDSAASLKKMVMLCCPSDSGRVALALTSGETACFCSPNFRAPNARDWKGMSAKSWRERKIGDQTPTLPDQVGGVPHPEFVEQLLGFPIGWTDLEASETPSCPKSQSGSADES
jgi:hypothetical protein